MPMPISPIAPGAAAALAPGVATALPPVRGEAGRGGAIFKDMLEGAIQRVESLRQAADQGIERTLAGEGEELHNTILAAQRAELAFELFMQARNKVTQAYQEIMRMQI